MTMRESIETERLLLRQWRAEDVPHFLAYYADAESARFVGGQKSAEDAWLHLASNIGHWQLKGFGYWAVEERSSGNFVGCVGLWKSIGWPELELGYWLLNDYHGTGYALEAAQACRDYARETLKSNSLVSYIDAENIPSIKLAEKLGAHYEQSIDLLSHGPHGVYRHF